MSSKYFEFYNANPFGNTKLGDCSVRSISKALNIPYKDVCKKLNVEYKDGIGMTTIGGVDLYFLQKKFNRYFDTVENFDSESYTKPEDIDDQTDPFFEPDEFDNDLTNNISVNQFIEMYKGRYLVCCADKNGVTGMHIVYVDADEKKFYDTWDCGKKKVNSYMRIKDSSEFGKRTKSDNNIRKTVKSMSADDMLKRLQKFVLETLNYAVTKDDCGPQ